MRVPILTYHHVGGNFASGDFVISINNFQRQIRYLRNEGYVPITLEDLVDWLQTGRTLTPRSIILTFDDGFLDCYENAWPLLTKYEIKFMVFLVSAYVGGTNQWDAPSTRRIALMNRNQIREMHAAGVSFGAHSSTHPSLIRLAAGDLKREITECRRQSREILGMEPRFFAYPFGEFTAQVGKEIKDAGFAGACTTLSGLNDKQTDPFQLRRVHISGMDTLFDFRLKLKFGFGLLSYANLKRAVNHLFREKTILAKYEAIHRSALV